MMPETKEEFDVALSFSGAQRSYVERVAAELKKLGMKVFYDADAEIEIWGNDLLKYLQDVYGTGKARYCVVFISADYHIRPYSAYELQNASAYAVLKNPGYVLPVLLEGDALPTPLPPTLAYVDARGAKPEVIAEKIVAKVSGRKAADAKSTVDNIKRPRIPSRGRDDWKSSPDEVMNYLVEGLRQRKDALEDQDIAIRINERAGRQIVQVLRGKEKIYSFAVWLGGFTGDDDISFYDWRGRNISGENAITASGQVVWNKERNEYVVEVVNMSFLEGIGTSYVLSPEELVEAIWDKIVAVVEEAYQT